MTATGMPQGTGAIDIAQFLRPRPVADREATFAGAIRWLRRRSTAAFLVRPAVTAAIVGAAVAGSGAEVVRDLTSAEPVAPVTAAPFERGERMSLPLRSGTPFVLDRWEITTRGVAWSADDQVRRVNAFPLAPPPGWQWALLDLSILNRSGETASASLIEVTLVSGSLEVSASHAARQVPAQVIPNELDVIELPAGGRRAGTVGFLVPDSARTLCALRVDQRTADSATPVRSVWIACDASPLSSRSAH